MVEVGVVEVTVVLQLLFAGLAFGWRSLRQRRQTGSPGFVALREWGLVATAAGVALVLGVVGLAAGTWTASDVAGSALSVLGAAAMAAGLVLTLLAQVQMGASWRIGVDLRERTALVTSGLFGRVRNPIFSAMLLFALGNAVAVPAPLVLLGAALLSAGIVVQVLAVEEPHLRRVHGQEYLRYAASAGRFLPKFRCTRPAERGR